MKVVEGQSRTLFLSTEIKEEAGRDSWEERQAFLLGRLLALADALGDAVVLDSDSSSPRGSTSESSVGTLEERDGQMKRRKSVIVLSFGAERNGTHKSVVGKGGPDLTGVLATREDLVGLNDGVSSVKEPVAETQTSQSFQTAV